MKTSLSPIVLLAAAALFINSSVLMLLDLGKVYAASIDITTITLSGPATIPCCGTGTFGLTVNGTGADPSSLLSLVGWRVFDNDTFSADELLKVGGTFDGTGTVNFTTPTMWTYTTDFTLNCIDCDVVKGSEGNSDESGANVFVQLAGAAFPTLTLTGLKDSNVLDVVCVAPEPNTMLPLAFGLAGLGGFVWIRRRQS